ncbi:hypothetical protein TIFTF001_009737 [Ficus carica]|uniref:Uncharacterized protein n=1 Tax=Ficus carica TaxID=3494 RepID=A0AA88D1K0_FICCA|nr:hypothetical protein TIFTF001_009737 [Ficus carica]
MGLFCGGRADMESRCSWPPLGELNPDDPEEDDSEGDTRCNFNPIVPKGDSVLLVLLSHRNNLVRKGLPSLDRVRVGMKGIEVEYLFQRFSAIGVVAESYSVLERASSTGHLLWVRNGERMMVPCFRSVEGMCDMMIWLGMVGEVENTMCSRMDSYFRCSSVRGAT